MGSAWKRLLCRVLMVLAAWMPFHYAQAGMIGTEALAAASASAERLAVVSFVSRADVASRLQSFGIDPASAHERVAALTEEEARYLAGHIDAAPAGGQLLLVLLVVLLVWLLVR